MSPTRILSPHWLAATLLLLLVMGGFPGMTLAEDAGKKTTAAGQEKDGKGKGKAEKEKEGDAAGGTPATQPQTAPAPVPTQGLFAFGKMLPVGQPHKELEIPSFKNGAPSSMVQAKVMTRTDDENMFLEQMNIWMYAPPGQAEKDMRVQLRTATYHMPSNIIASDERSRISRADFDLQGDTLIFDTATGQGKMVGNVQMILHDSSSFTKPSVEKEKKENQSVKEEKDSSTSSPAPTSPSAGRSPAAAITPAAATSPQKPRAGSPPTNPKK